MGEIMNQSTSKSFHSYTRFAKAVLIAGALFTIGLTQSAMADTTTVVNFDSIDTSGGAVTGAPVISLLNSYGISLSSTYIGVYPYLFSPPYFSSSLSTNVLGVAWTADTYFTYTLGFSKPLDSLTFSTPAMTTVWMAAWSATAYAANNSVLGSVGNPSLSCGYCGGIPEKFYTFNGPNIDHVLFSSNAESFAGQNLVIGSLQFTTPVPEPETYAMLLAGLGFLGFTTRRRNNSAA
jgi:PEP-CTERM motif